MRYKGTELTLKRIAKETKVDTVVEGSVLLESNEMLVRVRVLDADSEQNLFAGEFSKEFKDLIELQNEIARTVSTQVQLRMSPEVEDQLTRKQPVDPEAYESYLRGLYLLNRRDKLEVAVDFPIRN